MYDIFLSYSTQDRERLHPLFTALSQQGWSVFWDHQAIHTGDNWHVRIDEAINNSRCVVVVWSEYSVKSEWVLEEAHKGKRRGVLLPIRIDGVEPPFGFSLRQAGDFSHWNGKPDQPVFIELAAQIYGLLGNPPPQPYQSASKPSSSRSGLAMAGIAAAAVAGGGAVWYAQSHGGMHDDAPPRIAQAPVETTSPAVSQQPIAASAKPEPPKRYHLTVSATPANAVITVDGDAYDSGKTWEPGTHTVKASADGYQTQEKTFTIASSDETLNIELKPARSEYEPEMVDIPAGTFTMGCDGKRDDVEGGCYDNEKPAHKVTLKAFKLAKTEVTVAQFRAFVDATGYKTTAETEGSCFSLDEKGSWSDVKGNSWRKLGFKQTDNDPVACVSWNDTQKYIDWLNQKIQPTEPYRLPTEAEWEYAARGDQAKGDKDGAYPWGQKASDGCSFANMADQKAKEKYPDWTVADCNDDYIYTAPVGSYKPDGYGLYDMQGNVWERVQDWYAGDYYKSSPVSAPQGPSSGANRVIRGGSWDNEPRDVRSAFRGGNAPGFRFSGAGFRLAQDGQ